MGKDSGFISASNEDSFRSSHLLYFVFVSIVPAISHVLFSWAGYNPSDDGFILAYSRRILEGQIPHLDFISIRPVGSAILHLPVVLLGGGYTYWISRFVVWCEFAVMAAAWTHVFSSFASLKVRLFDKTLFFFVAYIFSVHTFPVMAWHTIDGLLMISLGLVWTRKKKPAVKFIGFFFLGLSCLFKQSFIPAVFVLPFIWNEWKNKKTWVAIFLPGLLYSGYLLVAGAFGDAFIQLCFQTGIIQAGFISYLTEWITFPLGIIWGFLSCLLMYRRKLLNGVFKPNFLRAAGMTALGVSLFTYPAGLWMGRAVWNLAFWLFGIVAGTALYFFLFAKRSERGNVLKPVLSALVIAWSVSLSKGYNSPSLAAGILALVILLLIFSVFPSGAGKNVKRLFGLLKCALLIMSVGAFVWARYNHIYLERPASDLEYSLEDIFPGTKKIRTNENTFRFLKDLDRAVEKYRGEEFTIIPDCAGYWVKASQVNPLSIDWLQPVELKNQRLVDRLENEIRSKQGLILIVQKVHAEYLFREFRPIPENSAYKLVNFIRTGGRKFAGTEYFDMYRFLYEGEK
ncbi:MAG: hypothetical protein JXB26_09200 [Candidatus Aminicenantes bacterium]|nr:hypothetical protein [Candidatus Aminicenantes bacterium]